MSAPTELDCWRGLAQGVFCVDMTSAVYIAREMLLSHRGPWEGGAGRRLFYLFFEGGGRACFWGGFGVGDAFAACGTRPVTTEGRKVSVAT